MAFPYITFQRKLTLNHQKFNLITCRFWPLAASYGMLELHLAKEHLKIQYITWSGKQNNLLFGYSYIILSP